MSPRRKLLVLLIITAATGVYALWRLPGWGLRLIEYSLGHFFLRPVHVASLGLRPQTLELELRGLRVAGLSKEAPPFLEAPLVRVRPSLAPLRFDRIVLARVRVEGLRVRINAFPDPPNGPGGDDIPKMGSGGRGGRGLQLGIERLVIVGGEFILDHARVPLDLDLPDFRGRLTDRPGEGLAGHLSFQPGRLKMGDAPALPVGTEIDLAFRRGALIVEGARLFAENTDVSYYGRLRLSGRPQGQLWLDGPIDLAVLERHVFRSGLGFSGAARWSGLLSIDGSRLRIEGRMQGAEGRFMGVAVEHFSTALSYDGSSGLTLRSLDVAALGGTGQLAIDVPPASKGRPIAIRGTMREGDGERLLRMIFGWGALGIGTAATGTLDLHWPRGDTRSITGRIGVDLAARADGRVPLAGRLDWSSENGNQSYERLELRGPGMQGRASGSVDRSENTRLEIEGETSDLAAADALLVQLRRGLGSPEAQPTGFSGAGGFRGHWRGSLEWPRFAGRFSGTHVGYLGVDWGRAEWSGSLDTAAESVESHSLVLRKDGGELWWDGRSDIGWFGQRDAIDGRVRIASWPVEDLVRFMEWRVELTGRASGEATVRGRRSAPEGEARVTARSGRYYTVAYDSARIETRWKNRMAEVTKGEVSLGQGKARFHGTLSDEGIYDGAGEMQDVDLGSLMPLAAGPAYGGRVSGQLVFQGTLARPRLRATLHSPRLFFGDEGIGALEAELAATGDGRVNVEGTCRSGRVDLKLAGGVSAVAPYDASLTLAARSTSLDPFLRTVRPSLPSALALVATGEVTIAGPLQNPSAVRAEASLPDLQVLVPDFAVSAREPVRVTVSQGRLEIGHLHLEGEGTDLEVQGAGDLLGTGPLALAARGHADLRALSLVTRRLRGIGTARLSADLTGTSRAPHLAGTLELQGAGLRIRGFPHGIEGLQGRVRFSENAAELEDVSGTLAGGSLTLRGQATYSEGRLLSYDVRPIGRGLALRYPEGARTLLDARLRLFGNADRQWITGTIDVLQALYARRYDVASELLASRRALAHAPASLDEGAQLDIHVRIPGTLRVDNNLATLTARADLQVQGTTRAPVVTGRAEIERGRVYFQGQTYVVQRGTLDFVNPRRLEPLFDIEAETRVRAYRVTLRVSGTLERVTPSFTSDPPLSSLQILALLAGQDEGQVANLTQTEARQNQAQLAKAGAATLAAGRISESVGLEREAQRLFGLSRFSIDPSLLRGAGASTARVTAGKRWTLPKQLGADLSVLYSQDLSRTDQERILALEYNINDSLSLLLTRTDTGASRTGSSNAGVEQGIAFDVRVRQSR